MKINQFIRTEISTEVKILSKDLMILTILYDEIHNVYNKEIPLLSITRENCKSSLNEYRSMNQRRYDSL